MNHDEHDRDAHDRPQQDRSAGADGRGRIRRYDPDAEEGGGGLSPALRRTALFVLTGVGMLLLGAAVQPRFKSAKVEPEAGVQVTAGLASATSVALAVKVTTAPTSERPRVSLAASAAASNGSRCKRTVAVIDATPL